MFPLPQGKLEHVGHTCLPFVEAPNIYFVLQTRCITRVAGYIVLCPALQYICVSVLIFCQILCWRYLELKVRPDPE